MGASPPEERECSDNDDDSVEELLFWDACASPVDSAEGSHHLQHPTNFSYTELLIGQFQAKYDKFSVRSRAGSS